MEVLRVVVVVIVELLLLLLVVGFATCAAGRPRSVVDEVPAAIKEEVGSPPWGFVAPRRPDALNRHFPQFPGVLKQQNPSRYELSTAN